LSLPRTRYGGIQCFLAVIDSAPIFIGVTRRNDVRGRFSKVSLRHGSTGSPWQNPRILAFYDFVNIYYGSYHFAKE